LEGYRANRCSMIPSLDLVMARVASGPASWDEAGLMIVGDLRVMRDTATMLGSTMAFQHIDDLAQARFAPSVVECWVRLALSLGQCPLPALTRCWARRRRCICKRRSSWR
jgi:hypothetical protein